MDMVTHAMVQEEHYKKLLLELYDEMPSCERTNGLWLISKHVQNVLSSTLTFKQGHFCTLTDELDDGASMINMLFGMPVAMPATVAASYIALCNVKTGHLLEVF